jgi:hypothetical protein
MNRFVIHNNGLNVPASLRYTIYDKRDDIVVAAHTNETKAIEDCQTLNRMHSEPAYA